MRASDPKCFLLDRGHEFYDDARESKEIWELPGPERAVEQTAS